MHVSKHNPLCWTDNTKRWKCWGRMDRALLECARTICKPDTVDCYKDKYGNGWVIGEYRRPIHDKTLFKQPLEKLSIECIMSEDDLVHTPQCITCAVMVKYEV